MNLKKIGVSIALGAATVTGGTLAVDAQIDPYIDNGSYYELDIISDIEQGERVEISKNEAAMTLRGWNDEYAITIKPQIPTTQFGAVDKDFNVEANRPLFSKRMEYRSGEVAAFIEPKEGTQNEFDIDFTLDSKPDTNVFEYKIEGAEDFDFFYQPELTPEEIADGAERPENVVGSYAVYHKTKANHRVGSTNYATGKVFHIYRPKAIGANGVEVWAKLNYENGNLSVTVPQKFLDEAVYPVVVDPTFGSTSCGTVAFDIAQESSDTSERHGRGVNLSVDGTLQALSACYSATLGEESSVDVSMFLNIEDTAGDSHTQVAALEQTNTFITAGGIGNIGAWHTFIASSEAIVADDYIVSALANGEEVLSTSNRIRMRGDVGASGNIYSETSTGAGSYAARKESPWTETDSASTNIASMYVVYNCATCATEILFTYSTTWTAPTGVFSANVACWGGGGGGDVIGGSAGGAGGGGAFASSTVALTPGNGYTITIGAAGISGTSPTDGGDSSFVANDKTVLADAGKQGASTVGGAGGLTEGAASTGDVENVGGSGGSSDSTDDAGGGGGGAGGPAGAGANGSNADAAGNVGGAGGAGNNSAGGAGGAADINDAITPPGGSGGLSLLGGGGGGGGDNGDGGGPGGFIGGGAGGGEIDDAVDGGAGACYATYTVTVVAPITPRTSIESGTTIIQGGTVTIP